MTILFNQELNNELGNALNVSPEQAKKDALEINLSHALINALTPRKAPAVSWQHFGPKVNRENLGSPAKLRL